MSVVSIFGNKTNIYENYVIFIDKYLRARCLSAGYELIRDFFGWLFLLYRKKEKNIVHQSEIQGI